MADTFDPYPSGYTNTGTLSSDDPLLDWGSNLKPSDLYRYTHDPEGFKQQMIDQGIPPPQHNYMPTDRGLQAVDNSGMPVRRSQLPPQITGDAFGFQGEGRGQPAALAFAGDRPWYQQDNGVLPVNAIKTLATSGNQTMPPLKPEETGPNPLIEEGKRRLRESGQAKPYPPTEQPGTPPILRQPPAGPGIVNDPSTGNLTGPVIADPAEARRRMNERFAPFGRTEVGPKPAEATPTRTPTPAPKLPEPITVNPLPPVVPQVDALNPTEKAEVIAKKNKEEALSNFAKSLQGIKAPTPPPLNAVGTPSVRSPTGIHPSVQNLLTMTGQQHPAAVASLMRLLGRA